MCKIKVKGVIPKFDLSLTNNSFSVFLIVLLSNMEGYLFNG